MRPVGVVGLDLSLTATAACYLPPGWSPRDARRGLRVDVFGRAIEGADDLQRVMRIHDIAVGVADFVLSCYPECGYEKPRVFVEDYAYGRGALSGVRLGELGGAVKAELYRRLNIVAAPIAATRARAYLLGRLPRGKGTQGPAVQAAVARLGLEFPASDPVDAFVVANAGRAELGMPGCTLAG